METFLGVGFSGLLNKTAANLADSPLSPPFAREDSVLVNGAQKTATQRRHDVNTDSNFIFVDMENYEACGSPLNSELSAALYCSHAPCSTQRILRFRYNDRAICDYD